jgi:hypothetical protein
MLSVNLLNVIILSATFCYCSAECQYADCHYTECRYAECCGVSKINIAIVFWKNLKF